MCLPWRSGSLKHPVVRWYFACERKKVTGFSNEEEKLAELDKYVPFLTETELVDRGVLYQKAAEPWAVFAVEDERLISGQSPASGGAVAELLLKALQ